MTTRVLVVQHAEKERDAGDPPLTKNGRAQAEALAEWVASHERPDAVWSSPMRRAVQTATAIGAAVGVRVTVDPRLRERMNWDGSVTFPEFLEEWRRASSDRCYRPRGGDSSHEAARRFLDALSDITAHAGTAVVVSHGGVTTDALRTLVGNDDESEVIDDGVPPCAVTILVAGVNGWRVESVAERVCLPRSG